MMPYSWDQLNELLDAHAGVAYILSLDLFRENAGDLLAAFRRYYPNTNLGYSYKTNYLPVLCAEADKLGMYAEVVSGMEYAIACKCGVKEDRIIFNGPSKNESELTAAFVGNARVNIDSLDELDTISRILAQHKDLHVKVGLRCNLDLQWKGRASRFGISDANGDLKIAVDFVRRIPNATLSGLHCHFSFDRSAQSYRQRTTKMVELAQRFFPDALPEYLDIGGGFYGPMPESLREHFSHKIPSYEEYAEAIAQVIVEEYGVADAPELILEPGVGLVGNVMEYACRVEAVKAMPGRNLAVTSGSVGHLKIVSNDVNLPMTVLSHPSEATITAGKEPIDVVGFTCLEHDTLQFGYLGKIRRNDILLFSNVGAYSFVTSPPFIRTTPSIVMSGAESGWETLMQRTTVDQLLTQFTW